MNKPFFVTNSFGRILRFGSAEDQFINLQAGDGEAVHVGVVPDSATHFDGLSFSASPAMPSEWHIWSDELGEWILSADGLDLMRSAAIQQRNDLLLASDWTQLPDSPIQNKAAWGAYRQALRDITLTPEFPINFSWPQAPEVAN